MKEYTVVFKLNDVMVMGTTIMAESEEQALLNTEWLPYFKGLEYNKQEAWLTYGG